MEPFVVRRSAWRMWGVSLLGVPMVVAALDMLTQRRLTNALRDLLFRPDDTQLPEPRETVWAVLLLVAGALLCVWGLKELLAPARVAIADGYGLRLKVYGPLRDHLALRWEDIEDLGSGTVEDEGDLLPVFWVRTPEVGMLPPNPWGARLLDDRTLAVLASDWEIGHVAAAEGIGDVAILSQEGPAPTGGDPTTPDRGAAPREQGSSVPERP